MLELYVFSALCGLAIWFLKTRTGCRLVAMLYLQLEWLLIIVHQVAGFVVNLCALNMAKSFDKVNNFSLFMEPVDCALALVFICHFSSLV